jgi:hypothetical protein
MFKMRLIDEHMSQSSAAHRSRTRRQQHCRSPSPDASTCNVVGGTELAEFVPSLAKAIPANSGTRYAGDKNPASSVKISQTLVSS